MTPRDAAHVTIAAGALLRAGAKRRNDDRLGAELGIAEAHHAVRFGAAPQGTATNSRGDAG